ncbi:dinitrogenase iron-molybdenum cofactor biosynthesis protein [bacterium]|nr:MAG: dinitrogenase iron-molybdenum cofactor biosynthesis protein [bacterium]
MELSLPDEIIAFAVWNNRIAPVFDVAHRVCIVNVESGRVIGEREISLEKGTNSQRALRLAELGVHTLVCGAISRQLLATMKAYGIDVVSSVAGECDEVLQAYLTGGVELQGFSIPALRRSHRKSSE